MVLLFASVALAEGDEGYDGVRRVISDGKILLELEPDELFIFTTNSKIYEKSFVAREKLIGKYIKEIFPDLKYRIVDWDENGIREQHLVQSGVYPDLFLGNDGIIKKTGMEYDLRLLIEKYNFALDKIDKAYMNIVCDNVTGAVLAIPFENNDRLLFYNKRLFDLKDVPYPTAGMTYDEAYDKAKVLTFGLDFTMCKGYLQHPDHYLTGNQLGLIPLSLTEPNKVELDTPEWNYLVDNLLRFFEIRGNIWTTTDDFFTKGTAAS